MEPTGQLRRAFKLASRYLSVVVQAERRLEFVAEADAVIVGSGVKTRGKAVAPSSGGHVV